MTGVLRSERTGVDEAGLPRWRIELADGRFVPWEGFYTGPVILDRDELATLADELLGLDLDAVPALAAERLRPTQESGDEGSPHLLLHSPTRTKKHFDGDLAEVVAGGGPYDQAAHVETRVVSLAQPGDVAVGRTAPWRAAVEQQGVDAIDVGSLDLFYLSDALLVLARRHLDREEPAITALIDVLRRQPDTIVRLYALDLELQVFLLWLAQRAGLDHLRVDANSPVVSSRWNQKSPLHPSIDDVRDLDAAPATADEAAELLEREHDLADIRRVLGAHIAPLPGYVVARRGTDEATFRRGVLDAARRLGAVYGIEQVCLKPSEATAGARIVTGLDVSDEATLSSAAADAYPHGDDYLVEANVRFRSFAAAGREFILAPAGHIAGGEVLPGLTVQLVAGRTWEGNAYLDERTCESVGISVDEYEAMRRDLDALVAAFRAPRSSDAGTAGGLVTGGVDFAVGTVGGVFGERSLAAATDFNLSDNGGAYMRAFLADVRRRPGGQDCYVATRVVRPVASIPLAAARERIRQAMPDAHSAVIVLVPGRFAMVATTAPDTTTAIENVEALVDLLR